MPTASLATLAALAALAPFPHLAGLAPPRTAHTRRVGHHIIVGCHAIGERAVVGSAGVEIKARSLRIVYGQLRTRRLVAAVRVRVARAVRTASL
jgi:hypothetical protein